MMSTNNTDSNKCEEKADRVSLCVIADAEVSEEQIDEVCASCGNAEVDNVKLKKCTCELVKYCSDGCRGEHREQHNEECKKRTEELHDKKLFTQPDRCCFGECPICFLLMPLDMNKSSVIYSCCSKQICNGCDHAHRMSNKQRSCPFCREPLVDAKENVKRVMKRVKANDPAAIVHRGLYLNDEGDFDGAFEYLTKAAELGDMNAHNELGIMYEKGQGVEKDEEKAVYHYEKAAIGGDPYARNNLGCYEEINGRIDRAVKHFTIAANLGHIKSMRALWRHYAQGNISKEDLESTLRAHHAAIDAMKSQQREAAAAATVYG